MVKPKVDTARHRQEQIPCIARSPFVWLNPGREKQESGPGQFEFAAPPDVHWRPIAPGENRPFSLPQGAGQRRGPTGYVDLGSPSPPGLSPHIRCSTCPFSPDYRAATSASSPREGTVPKPSIDFLKAMALQSMNDFGSKSGSAITPQTFRRCIPMLPAS